MCTAITIKSKYNYFGRNLDIEYSYDEHITICPRKYEFSFGSVSGSEKNYAIIGMATVIDNYPLYYDATNEMGLSMAGLSFPKNAFYGERVEEKNNISPYEFIPRVLRSCKNVEEAKHMIDKLNLINKPFSPQMPLTDLHWIIADKCSSIVVEPLKDGMRVYQNPIGILTNNPPFKYHLHNLNNYMFLSKDAPENRFSQDIHMHVYSRGMGAIGLPGDYSSMSRFIKAAFVKYNCPEKNKESDCVNNFFHILSSVEMPEGAVCLADGVYEKTFYSSCCNTDLGIYYYRTYDNSQITMVKMFNENLDSEELIKYRLINKQNVYLQN